MEQIPNAIREVVELYEDRREQLRFPDLDAGTLDVALEHLAEAKRAVTEAHAQLEAAREREREHEANLLALSRRAFAYARIFAETDAELSDALGSFGLARDERKARPGGRKKKTGKRSSQEADGDSTGTLPFEEEAVSNA